MESMPTGLCEVSERFVPEWLLRKELDAADDLNSPSLNESQTL
jgi:hypothetical protein